MANEIGYQHLWTGATLYAIILDLLGRAWNGTAFEARVVANWGNYDVALAESEAGSYWYAGTFPAAIPDGTYAVQVFERAGAAPAATDELLGTGRIQWMAGAELDLALGVNVIKVSGDSGAADALEAVLDGTGAVLTLAQLRINSAAAGGAIDIDNSGGSGIECRGLVGAILEGSAGDGVLLLSTGNNGHGLEVMGHVLGCGLYVAAGIQGTAVLARGGYAAAAGKGYALRLEAQAVDRDALSVSVSGSGLPVDASIGVQIAAGIWGATGRTLTSFGTLVADLATAAWAAIRGTGTRTLADLATPADVPTAGAIADTVCDEATAGHTILGTIGRALRDILAKTGLIGTASMNVTSPVDSESAFDLVQGDDYAAADAWALTWTKEHYAGPDLEGATASLRVQQRGAYNAGTDADVDLELTDGVVDVDGSGDDVTVTVTFNVTATETAALAASPPADKYPYVAHLTATKDTRTLTLMLGSLHVRRRIAP